MGDNSIEAEPLQEPKCPKCGAALPKEAKPLESVACPACGETVMVPGMLGQYRLTRLIGKGGMGAVYEGVDDGLQRKVAVKVILRGKAAEDPTFLESFRREAQAAAKLNNPHIVGVYAFGESAGQPYLVMELVQPDSLDRMMASGPMMPATVLNIGSQIAQGLKAAAEQGLVHGDVKPENILINADREAKLADFGIAALAGARAAANNEVWGTPYYIAPETLRRQKVDLRADIYSLGGTLYHAIAGVPPFEGADAVEVMKARLVGPARPLQEVAPDCPEAVAKIVMRMLESEPIRRYPNYDSLLSDMAKELRAAKSRTGGGKRIVLKGKTAPVGVGNSRPMPSVENLNSPLIPERKGMSRGAIIGLAAGLGCGVPLLLVGIGALLFFSFAAEKTEEIASELATAQAAAVNPALAQAAQDREALKALGEAAATTATQAKAHAAEAAAIVKGLAQQARRAVMPGQESWLEPSEGEAPTSMLKALQKAFAQSASLATAAKGADALRAKVDGLTATAEAPGTDTPEAIANALAEARKASEAYAKTPEAASATADMNALLAQKKGWRKTVDAARAEMEAAVKAKLAAENEAKRKAAEAAAAERVREAAQAEVASVATMETAVGEELNRFMPEAALKAFKSRAARLKSSEAKTAAEVSVERLTAYVRLKTWLVDKAAKGELASFGIASADTESVTFSGKRVPWGEFVADRQAVVFRILNTLVADDTGARALGAGERAELAVSARLFVTRYFGTETLAKSKTLRDMMDKLRTVAEALPGPKAELERVEGATPAAE